MKENDTPVTVVTVHSQWMKYDPLSVLAPSMGEWCLWSMVIEGQRNQFSGRLFCQENGKILLRWDGYKTLVPDDTLYFARVSKPIIDEVDNPKLFSISEYYNNEMD